MNTTVAVLHPGEMGAAVGASLTVPGHRVVWASRGRSAASRRRAEAGGCEDLGSVADCIAAAGVVLSICPPHAAVAVAEEVAAVGFRGVYVDANAVAPTTTRTIASIIESGGAVFVDGGIVGPPPVSLRDDSHASTPPGRTRLYLSGAGSPTVAGLFDGSPLPAIVVDGPIGAASALKMCYAAWTKGSIALLGAIRAVATAEGIDNELLGEWALSQPDISGRSQAVATSAPKAWRWVGEMEEIAATFTAVGLPSGFHIAAAEIYARLADFKDQMPAPTLSTVVDALRSA